MTTTIEPPTTAPAPARTEVPTLPRHLLTTGDLTLPAVGG